MNRRLIFSLSIATALGLIIGFIDTRPNWDDTGVSMMMILSAASFCGYVSDGRAWLIALAVGIWVPIFNIVMASNYSSFLALIPAFTGAYTGSFLRSVLVSRKQ